MKQLIENVADRYIKSSNNGLISYTDELNILAHLVNKFNLKTKSQEAQRQGVTIQAISKQCITGKLMCIELANKTFII